MGHKCPAHWNQIPIPYRERELFCFIKNHFSDDYVFLKVLFQARRAVLLKQQLSSLVM
jgi:hypothetical protein